jgi:hypothetical protein
MGPYLGDCPMVLARLNNGHSDSISHQAHDLVIVLIQMAVVSNVPKLKQKIL